MAPTSTNDADKISLLVTTSTFPMGPEDPQPGFVKTLCDHLHNSAANLSVQVLAPNHPQVEQDLAADSYPVYRFRYFLPNYETLAYGSGILENIKFARWKLALIPFFLFFQAVSLSRLVHRHSISVVQAHWLLPQGLVAAVVKKLSRRPFKLMVVSHGADLFAFNSRWGRWLKRWVLGQVEELVVVSQAMRSFAMANLAVPSERIKVLPMGVDLTKQFTPDPAIARAPGSIIYVGRLAEKKGVNFLLDAVAILAQRKINIKLTIIGAGHLSATLQAQVKRLKISDFVEFKGAVLNEKIPEYLRQNAIAVVPSIVTTSGDQEGLGLTTVETIGCGCALVASELPAIKDVVIHEVTGILVPSANPVALANAIQQLVENAELRQRLVTAGLEKIRLEYDWSIVTQRYISAVKGIASR